MAVVAATAALGTIASLTGCSGGSGSKTLATVTTVPATSTTSSVPASTSTSVEVTTTAVSVPGTGAATPEEQAKAFYEAWKKGDRTAAATLGQPAAVAAIFTRPWSASDGWTFSECSGAAGSAICTWDGSSGQLKMLVRGATGGLSVSVVDVRFA